MPTVWRWVIVTQAGYYTGNEPPYSSLLKDVSDQAYFETQEEAIAYSTNTLSLQAAEREICKVVYASLRSHF